MRDALLLLRSGLASKSACTRWLQQPRKAAPIDGQQRGASRPPRSEAVQQIPARNWHNHPLFDLRKKWGGQGFSGLWYSLLLRRIKLSSCLNREGCRNMAGFELRSVAAGRLGR